MGEAEVEEEIAMLRLAILQLKAQLASAFAHPSEFVALADALRAETATLARLEAKLRDMRLESREEVWWFGSKPNGGGKPLSLPKSVRAVERR